MADQRRLLAGFVGCLIGAVIVGVAFTALVDPHDPVYGSLFGGASAVIGAVLGAGWVRRQERTNR